MPELTFTEAGWSTVQDLGRFGYSRYGVSRGGSADQYSARCANALVANPPGHPLIEATARDLAFMPDADVLVAVTGAPCELRVAGVRTTRWQPVAVPAGALVEISEIRDGLRVYVALNGRLDVPSVLGSVAPDAGLGVGCTLAAGGQLTVESDFRWFAHPFSGIPLLRPAVSVPRFGEPWLIDVVEGPDASDFARTADRLVTQAYLVAPRSNAVGLRLTGAAPERETSREILSRGVAIGSVEIPPSSELLVLMRGRMLTAGYPVIAVASSVAQSRLGQVRPGDTVRFRMRSLADVRSDAQRERAALDTVGRAVAAILQGCGIHSLTG